MRMKSGDGYGGQGIHCLPSEQHQNTIIFLHGLGDSGEGWLSLLSLLRYSQFFHTTKFIFPTAPTRSITWNGGMRMPGWGDIKGLTPNHEEDETGYNQSAMRIRNIISGEISNGVPASKIVLGGFSQGGAIAYLTLIQLNQRLGGVISLSSWAPLLKYNTNDLSEETLQTPILHCHGIDDDIVECHWGKTSVAALEKIGFNVKLKLFSGIGHTTCNEELQNFIEFLKEIFEEKKTANNTNE